MKFRYPIVTAALGASVLAHHAAAQARPKFTTLYNFTGGSDGAWPGGALVAGQNGALYGTAQGGGSNPTVQCNPFGGPPGCGTVFQLTPGEEGAPWTLAVIHSFAGYPGDGGAPEGGLTTNETGAFYGTTMVGGDVSCPGIFGGCGAVLELTPPAEPGAPWTETVIHNMTDWGYHPETSLAAGRDGVLYGTGAAGTGGWLLFGLEPPPSPGGAWTFKVLVYLLPDAPAGLAVSRQASDNAVIYGAGAGFDGAAGSVFEAARMAPGERWTVGNLYSFTGQNGDGTFPVAALIVTASGALYGTTNHGGYDNPLCTALPIGWTGCGTVFELVPSPGGAWTESVLYSFTGQNGDGALPMAGLVEGQDGALYGTTAAGGSGPCFFNSLQGCGTVFKLTPPAVTGGAWTEAVLHSFVGTDGAQPSSTLLLEKNCVLYGTAYNAGAVGYGTVFELTP
jgi:uncharacterized protein YceK